MTRNLKYRFFCEIVWLQVRCLTSPLQSAACFAQYPFSAQLLRDMRVERYSGTALLYSFHIQFVRQNREEFLREYRVCWNRKLCKRLADFDAGFFALFERRSDDGARHTHCL